MDFYAKILRNKSKGCPQGTTDADLYPPDWMENDRIWTHDQAEALKKSGYKLPTNARVAPPRVGNDGKAMKGKV